MADPNSPKSPQYRAVDSEGRFYADERTERTFLNHTLDITGLGRTERRRLVACLAQLPLLNMRNITKYAPFIKGKSSRAYTIQEDVLHGATLYDLIEDHVFHERRFEEDFVWDVLLQLLKGLAYLHEYEGIDGLKGVSHGSLTPECILFDSFGVLKISGLIRSCQNLASIKWAQKTTPYDPPELCENGSRTHICDTYNVARIIHELCTVDSRFGDSAGLSMAHLTRRYAFPEIPNTYSNELYNILSLMSSPDELRPSATSLLANLVVQSRMGEFLTRYGIVFEANNKTELMKAASRNDLATVEELLPYQAGFRDRAGRTALIYAAENQHSAVVQRLARYECRYRVQAAGELKGMTALMYAARSGDLETVRTLIPYEARIETSNGNFALRLAVTLGHIDCGTELFRYEYPLLRKFDWTTLMMTIVFTDSTLTESFIDPEICKQDKRGFTALMLAVTNHRNKLLSRLVEREAGMCNYNKYTALMAAARVGNLEAVIALRDKEAGMRDDMGWTALMYGARANQVETVLALIEAEAEIRSNGQQTAMMIAAQCGHDDIIRVLAPFESGCQDIDGFTAFLYAADRGNMEIVDFLLDLEGSIVSASGYTGLMLAAKKGHLAITKLLVKTQARGVTNSIHKAPGTTALIFACFSGRVAVVEVLLKHEKGMRTQSGLTALMAAVMSKHLDCVSLLIEHEFHIRDRDGRSVLDIETSPEILSLLRAYQSEHGPP
ncbi:Kinase, NEK [Giardia muris]|uniref:Kinase, NEK n=1 Tax=Giardia muris TaxID=5742 RepID=A0A4Z1T942_GIAMU|nr:Kinase, NEK [Giardia muris]|eukprot:TNJ29667.1 Kinase, NEK [Giardia muris]